MSERERIESQAVQWILRREDASWCIEDQRQLDAWLDESAAHEASYWRLYHGWRLADNSGEAEQASRFRWPLPQEWIKPLVAIAASLVVAMVTGSIWFASAWQAPTPSIQYMTRHGQRGDLRLSDGTKVELNTDTSVRVAQSETSRGLWIDKGEAYFEVAHDPSRPFVVHAGDRNVLVLGTKFNLYRDKAGIIVSVVEGRVHLAPTGAADDSAGFVLVRGDIATAKGASTLIASDAIDRITRQLQWRKGLLSFDNTDLVSAAEQFNRYNQQQIVITDQALARMRIGGSFRADDPEGFARLLHQAFDIHAQFSKDKITLDRD